MKKHRYTYLIATLLCLVALLSAACADDDSPSALADGRLIRLGATVEGLDTRAGQTGAIDYSTLALPTCAFGVFAYGPTAGGYSATLKPDLFCNTQVRYTGSESSPVANPADLFAYPENWTYGTPQYWPQSTETAQKISFFAYAPYVAAGSGTGTTGITAIDPADANTAGDPTLSYTIATTPTEAVDLLWGVNGDTGKPWTDATLKQTGGPILFTFRHALAAIGFHVQAMVDKDNDRQDYNDQSDVAGMLSASGNYKITIKKLTISGKDGNTFHQSGKFNLNSTVASPTWSDLTGTVTTLTVDTNMVSTDFKHPYPTIATTTATEATYIIQSSSIKGVTQDARQLLIAPHATTGMEQCFFVIPHAKQDYTVTLDWCLSGKTLNGTYIAEDRTSTLIIPDLPLQSGIKYYLNFVIGLRTLQLNVTATDWTTPPIPLPLDAIIEHGTSANSSLAPRRQQQ